MKPGDSKVAGSTCVALSPDLVEVNLGTGEEGVILEIWYMDDIITS